LTPESFWSGDPPRVDPDDYPAYQAFARELIAGTCPDCGVHVVQLTELCILQGLPCPKCAATVRATPSDPEAGLQCLMKREAAYAERLACS